MAITKEQKEQIIKDFGGDLKNTGAVEVQIAILTARINDLKDHFDKNKKDHNSRRGLLKIVGQRRRLLKYYKGVNLEGYRNLIAKLELRK